MDICILRHARYENNTEPTEGLEAILADINATYAKFTQHYDILPNEIVMTKKVKQALKLGDLPTLMGMKVVVE